MFLYVHAFACACALMAESIKVSVANSHVDSDGIRITCIDTVCVLLCPCVHVCIYIIFGMCTYLTNRHNHFKALDIHEFLLSAHFLRKT